MYLRRKPGRVSMRKRSGVPNHEADFLEGRLSELDQEIARCEMMRKIATNARNKKSLQSRIHWLQQVRSRHPELKVD
jgi:hypothetical protein